MDKTYGIDERGSMLDITPEQDLKKTIKKRRFEQIDFLLKQKMVPVKGRCIELGCGSGYFSMMLSKKKDVSEVIAVDISRQATERFRPIFLDYLKPDLSKLRYIVADMNEISSQEYGIFDTVIFCSSLHHSDDIPKSLRVANCLLKPGGGVFLQGEHYRSMFLDRKKKSGKTPQTIRDFSKVLKESGFKPIVFRYSLKTRKFPTFRRILLTAFPFKFVNGWFRFNSFVMLGVKNKQEE